MKDFRELVDLASAKLGGRVLFANDDFFAPKENLLKPSKPIFIEDKYTTRGKWMDGWESRRRRTPGFDYCLIRLGLPGLIRGVIVDTSFFRGNYPERCTIEACDLGDEPVNKNEIKRLQSSTTEWVEILPESQLAGNSENPFPIGVNGPFTQHFTHLRLKIFPDGGVARLRVHGEVIPKLSLASGRAPGRAIDLAAIENGGRPIQSSDQFYATPLNLLMPGRPRNTGEGWETRRRRGPGYDWVIVKLGAPGRIQKVELDTAHFIGNYPDTCSIETCRADGEADMGVLALSAEWQELLPRTKLKPNHRHIFAGELRDNGIASHVRLNIFPDGGVSRLRIYGLAETLEEQSRGIAGFNRLSFPEARKVLMDCCGSRRWVAGMLKKRPFASIEELLDAADSVWAAMGRKDRLEAFRHHPAIGSAKTKAKQSAAAKKWSAGEQSVAQKAGDETLALLASANTEYHEKFGHVFLICATGKTSEEILGSLRQRLDHNAEDELFIAAEEQRKIMRLRLEKLLGI